MNLDELSEIETNVVRALWVNDMAGGPRGLNAANVGVQSRILGYPIEASLGDITRTITGLIGAGLVRSYRRTGGRKSRCRQFRLSHAGRQLMLGVDLEKVFGEVPPAARGLVALLKTAQ